MKKWMKILLSTLAGLVLLLLLGAAYVNYSPVPTYKLATPTIEVPTDSASIARGEHLTALSCALCHRGKSGQAMEGGPWREKDLGDLYVANLTNHPNSTLSQYSDEELALLLRTGVKRNGEVALVMPRYAQMSDADLGSIIAFLRSDAPMTAPSDKQWPEREINYLAKLLTKIAIKPLPYSENVDNPVPDDKVEQGKYLAQNLACYHCHSADFATLNEADPEQSEGYFGGGNLILKKDGSKKIPSSNLTPHPEYGLGRYDLAGFGQAVRYGKSLNGKDLDHSMPRFTNLSDQEVEALWAYLQTLPVIENQIAAAE
ncbi:MAG: c-type cytochrome [Bacteroidetes bacterium]|jgi:mono/diheme cytochrome c family protein|nr:c-type cytochrome [Bacteroidota bacterium]